MDHAFVSYFSSCKLEIALAQERGAPSQYSKGLHVGILLSLRATCMHIMYIAATNGYLSLQQKHTCKLQLSLN